VLLVEVLHMVPRTITQLPKAAAADTQPRQET
jgi:hypothetical protein